MCYNVIKENKLKSIFKRKTNYKIKDITAVFNQVQSLKETARILGYSNRQQLIRWMKTHFNYRIEFSATEKKTNFLKEF